MTAVLLPADLPSGVDLSAVLADLAGDRVAAPHHDVAGLRSVVAQAQREGIDLRIIEVPTDPGHEEQLRDLATAVGKVDGGTVLVLSPHRTGSYSDHIDRFTLESAQNLTHTGNAVTGAQNFLGRIDEPQFPWAAFTAVLLVIVIALVAGGTWWNVRRHKAAAAGSGGAGRGGGSAVRSGGERNGHAAGDGRGKPNGDSNGKAQQAPADDAAAGPASPIAH